METTELLCAVFQSEMRCGAQIDSDQKIAQRRHRLTAVRRALRLLRGQCRETAAERCIVRIQREQYAALHMDGITGEVPFLFSYFFSAGILTSCNGQATKHNL